MKRWSYFVLCLCMILSMLPAMTIATKAATTGICGENLTWTLDNTTGALTISGTGSMDNYQNNSPWGASIKTVQIEDGVTSIGNRAFKDCTILTEIELPNTLTSIGSYAFYNCTSLNEVNYKATAEEWLKIDISWENEDLTSAYLSANTLSGSCGANLTWALDSTGELSIDGTGEMLGTDWQNWQSHWGPDEFPWYNYRGNISSIVLHEGVTTLGCAAFYGCTNLTSIVIPEDVYRVCGSAFGNCTALKEVTLPYSVETIESSAFRDCRALATVNYVGSVADWNSITIEEGNEPLQNAYLSSSTISGTCGEKLCWTLDGATKTLSISGTGMMSDYSPWGTASTAPWFPYRDNIQNVVFSEGITYIGENAFYSCSSLDNVTLPLSLTTIGYRAFANCSALAAFTVPPEHEVFKTDDGILFSKDGSTLVVFPGGYTSTSYTISNSVTAIADYAFCWCESLTDVSIPKTVAEIGDCAFSDCRSLENINIPNTVTAINYGTFYRCSNLSTVDIPETVTSIGSQAFYECQKIDGIEIPSGVTSIGDRAFKYCYELSEINLPEGITNIEDHTFFTCSRLTSVTLPQSLKSIGDEAFWYCRSLKSITIPASVTTIASTAFEECSGMESFIVHEDNMAYQAIEGTLLSKDTSELLCYPVGNLRTAYSIPSGVKIVHNNAFNGAENLKDIVIPASVESFGQHSFSNCSSLTSITIPDSLESFGNYCFLGCSSLKSITIPGNIETIPLQAFGYCDSLTEVILENGISVIDRSAFSYCKNLEKITLPLSVSEIGLKAFNECESLTTVYYGSTESLWKTVFIEKGNDYLINADYIFINPDNLQAALSTQTGELRICGVHEDAETVMIAFYNQNGQLERIKMFTADEVAFGVLISELDSQYVIQVMQINGGFSPVTTTVVP